MLAHQKRWNERFKFMKKNNNKILELGCYRGEMSKWFSDNLLDNQHSRLYCVDTWEGSEEHLTPGTGFYEEGFVNNPDYLYETFLENTKPVENIITPIRKPSLEAVKIYENNRLDFIFIDAAHDYDNVLADIKAWYPKCKKGTGTISLRKAQASHMINEQFITILPQGGSS